MVCYCKGADCTGKMTHANYGLKNSGKREWCGPCAKEQRGETERIGRRRMCEDCKGKVPHYGTEADPRKRWCCTCAEKHGKAVYIGTIPPSSGPGQTCYNKRCEACPGPLTGRKFAAFGLVGSSFETHSVI